MGVCWWCYWGWPQAIQDIYDDAVNDLGRSEALHFGPGHIVWEDENFDAAEWCLEHFDEYVGDLSPDECQVVRESLERLAALPQSLRRPPVGYDDENPEAFPPPAGLGFPSRTTTTDHT